MSLNIKKNVTEAVLSFLVNTALVFIGYRLVVKLGGSELLGIWSAIFAWIYMFRLADMGVSNSLTKFISPLDIRHDRQKIYELFNSALVINVVLYLILSVVSVTAFKAFGSYLVGDPLKNQAKSLIFLMAAGFLLTNIATVISGGLQAIHHGYLAYRLSVVAGVTQVSISIITIPSLGLLGLALAAMAQQLVIIIFGYVFFVMTIPGFKFGVSIKSIKYFLAFSLKIQAINSINGFFEPLSKLLVARIGGFHFSGIYEMAYKTVALPRNAAVAGVQAALPGITNLVNQDKIRAQALYSAAAKRLLFASIAVTLACVLLSPAISFYWLSQLSRDYIVAVLFIAIGFFFNTMGAPAYSLGFAVGLMRYNLYSSFLLLAILIVAGVTATLAANVYLVFAGVSAALATSGVYIKVKNEKLILGDMR